MDRRGFIGKAMVGGAVAVTGAAMLNSCKKGYSVDASGLPEIMDRAVPGRKLKAVLVGCGNRGTGAVLNFLAAGDDLELIGLADVFQDKLDDCRSKLDKNGVVLEDKNCFAGFDGYKRVLELDADVVLLATPPQFRPLHLKACIEARKHVFMEKPAAVDPVGARSIMATSKKAGGLGLTIITGTQRRHQEDYIETFRQVADGAIGIPVSARAWWLQSHVWFRTREEGWSDMEYHLRNWNNFCWLSGDHILDTHVHNIDIINWFLGRHPVSATGFGGRHRRLTGDQFDFFNVDFDFGEGLHSQSSCRQIDGCENGIGEVVMGTEGFTNCQNTIFNLDGSVKWQFKYPINQNGQSTGRVKIPAYVQEHIHLVTAIRNNQPVQEAEQTAISTLTAIMGRISAYTGKKQTWEQMMESSLRLGPESYDDLSLSTPVFQQPETPVPGIAHKAN